MFISSTGRERKTRKLQELAGGETVYRVYFQIFTRDEGRQLRVTTHKVLYREAPTERGNFFRLQVFERVEISLVEVYKKVGKPVISVCKKAHKA